MTYLYDSKCRELAEHFFGEKDPRLDEIAQAIQDRVEDFPNFHPDCECQAPEHDSKCRHSPDYDPTPYCSYGHRTKVECDCGPLAEND